MPGVPALCQTVRPGTSTKSTQTRQTMPVLARSDSANRNGDEEGLTGSDRLMLMTPGAKLQGTYWYDMGVVGKRRSSHGLLGKGSAPVTLC